MTPGDGDTPRLWRALVDVYQPVLRAVVDALERDAGIDSGVYSALAYLDGAGGELRIGALHALMRVRYSQPGLSRLVLRMDDDGLVVRRPDPDDGRATVVALTRAGRTRFARARRVYEGAVTAEIAPFVDPADARRLAAALEAVATARFRVAG